jgi:hypothetical protein
MKKEQIPSIQMTPDEKAKTLEERVRNDRELLRGGAKFKVNKNNNVGMVPTKEQEAIAKDEMNLDKQEESLDELLEEFSMLGPGDKKESKQLAEKIRLKNLSPDTKLALYKASDNNYYIADAIMDDLEFDQQLKLLGNVNSRHGYWPLTQKLLNLVEKRKGSAIDIVRVVGAVNKYSMHPSDSLALADRIPWDNLSNIDKIAAIQSTLSTGIQSTTAEKRINWDNLNPEELMTGLKSSKSVSANYLLDLANTKTEIWEKFTVGQLEELKKRMIPEPKDMRRENVNNLKKIEDLISKKRG